MQGSQRIEQKIGRSEYRYVHARARKGLSGQEQEVQKPVAGGASESGVQYYGKGVVNHGRAARTILTVGSTNLSTVRDRTTVCKI